MIPETRVSDEIAFWFKIYFLADIHQFKNF